MNRNFYNSRESSTQAGYQNPRWQTVFIALMLVLAIGSAGQPPLAQAAPAGRTELSFFMIANKEGGSKTACKGELVHINVLVYRLMLIDGVSAAPEAMTGVSVIGVVDNQNIGQISPSENTTIWASAIYPGAADFVFTAENYGETIVAFSAMIETDGWFGTNWGGGSQIVSAQFNVQVIPCKYKVTTIGAWNVPGPANISVAAISDDAEVRAADAQSPFTGSTSVSWILSAGRVEDCIPQSVTASSPVDWTGQMDDSGQLTLNGTYQSAAMSLPVYCVGSDGGIASGSTPVQLTPDPLQLYVASSGGVFKQSQVLQGPEATPGYVTIVVVPQEDEASAFNADSRAAFYPFEWWAMLWDNFTWLYNSPLALR